MNLFPAAYGFLTMMVGVAVWLGLLFLVVGLLSLIARRLARVERALHEMTADRGSVSVAGNDRTFLRGFVIAYFAVLLVIGLVLGSTLFFGVEGSNFSEKIIKRIESTQTPSANSL